MKKRKRAKLNVIEMPLKMNWGTQKLEPDLEELRNQHTEIKVKEVYPRMIFNKKFVVWYFIILILFLIITWTIYLILS